MKAGMHSLIAIGAAALCLLAPYGYFRSKGAFARNAADAVAGATVAIGEQPETIAYVLMNREKHPDSLQVWRDFFTGQDVDVIMEDLHCFVSRGDAAGTELAGWYQSRLAEHQMQMTAEDGILIASRAEQGLFDVIVLSGQTERAYDYSTVFSRTDVEVILVGEDS